MKNLLVKKKQQHINRQMEYVTSNSYSRLLQSRQIGGSMGRWEMRQVPELWAPIQTLGSLNSRIMSLSQTVSLSFLTDYGLVISTLSLLFLSYFLFLVYGQVSLRHIKDDDVQDVAIITTCAPHNNGQPPVARVGCRLLKSQLATRKKRQGVVHSSAVAPPSVGVGSRNSGDGGSYNS